MADAPSPYEQLTHNQVVDRFLDSYSVADICAQTGWPVADVEAHLEQEIRVLRQRVGKMADGAGR